MVIFLLVRLHIFHSLSLFLNEFVSCSVNLNYMHYQSVVLCDMRFIFVLSLIISTI